MLVAIGAWVGVSGCGGCRRAESPDAAQHAKSEAEREAERKRLEAERAKPDFELASSASLPADPNRMQLFAKPGHWSAAQSQLVANHYDFRGRFRVDALDLGAEARFQLEVTREIALAKGQKKRVEFSFYLPAGQETKQVPLALTTDSGRDVLAARDPATRLFAHQYYFAVLAREPDTFQFMRRLDTLQAPSGKYFSFNEPFDPHYRLTIVEPGGSAALPSRGSAWTSVAVLVWDDFDPKPLSPQQQRALVDWLHWGGELIISGPQTIDLLKQSFLADYLPADGAGAVELGADQLGELDRHYSSPAAMLTLPTAWTGERLTPRSGALVVLGSDELPLVVERAAGSGRVVVTAFRLNERALARWPGFDSFLNSCLLRRPARKFSRAGNSVALAWRDEHSWFDPRRVSRVRYFSRDAGQWRPWNQFGTAEAPRENSITSQQLIHANQLVPGAAPAAEELPFAQPGFGPGVAGWSDFGDVSQLAAGQLQDAAGIKIPSAEFVVRVLGVYLLVLVPLNFALFRLLGRVEWAWLAVPVISLGGALSVVYVAQLDIGFVRAQNDLAIVELQGDYPRAHVTRYTALYTSLTTRYAAEFDDPGGVALPLTAADEAPLPGQSRSTIALATDQTARLSDFRVASNSIGMLHGEHMLPLAGGLVLEPLPNGASAEFQVRNATGLALRDVRVVHRDVGGGGDRYGAGDRPRDGRAEVAKVGKLAPGEVRELVFAAMPRTSQKRKRAVAPPVEHTDSLPNAGDERAAGALSAAATPVASVNHDALVELAVDDCLNGEYRLVAWCDAPLGGMAIEPRATQRRQLSLVVAHLRYDASSTALARDSSSRREVELEIGRLPDDLNAIDYGDKQPAADAAPPGDPIDASSDSLHDRDPSVP